MKRIVIHWTAGRYKPNLTDIEHYHFLVDGEGIIHEGKYKPEDNENCDDGKYARHTGGGNTGSIGIALCGMYGFVSCDKPGNYPVTKRQAEALFKKCAQLCCKYNIPFDNVITHYEFGKSHPNTSSHGKIDIVYLAPYPDVKREEIGNFIRKKISSYSD